MVVCFDHASKDSMEALIRQNYVRHLDDTQTINDLKHALTRVRDLLDTVSDAYAVSIIEEALCYAS